MNSTSRAKIMAWVGSEILPHEADVRAWLRRSFKSDDLEDVIQEAYCQIAGLDDVGHIFSQRMPRSSSRSLSRKIFGTASSRHHRLPGL